MIEHSLSNCEELVMRCIWESEADVGVQQITELANEKYGKSWKQQTVSTFLVRLVRKGYAEMYRKGRSFLYHPVVDKKEYLETIMKDYIAFWNNGNVAEFMSDIYKSKIVSDKERKEIKDVMQRL